MITRCCQINISQETFQAVISTDGTLSFAAFIYENPERVNNLTYFHQVGFNAGDGTRALNILGLVPGEESYNYVGSLQGVNIFRIDGE